MASLAETRVQVLEFVMPQHTNTLGNLHGGHMMTWMVHAGTLAATRVARGPVVLGAIDSLHFLHPVREREIVTLDAWVEFVGTSSLEVAVEVFSEAPETGERKHTTRSYMAFVAIDPDGRPRPVPTRLEPADGAERRVWEQARLRRSLRLEDLRREREALREPTPRHRFFVDSVHIVQPEEAVHSNLMFGGRLLKIIDELAGLVGVRYTRGVTVTASLDAMGFYRPIRVGDVLVLRAGLNYVGRTSLEIGVDVVVERPRTGEREYASRALFTFVHLGRDMRPTPVPPFTPETPEEEARWREAEVRRARRLERARLLRALLEPEGGAP